MNKKAAGLIGVIAGLASMGTAEALPNPDYLAHETMQVSSYKDLLKPIPNAVEQLKAHDAMLAAQQAKTGTVILAQYDGQNDHHHHHHHEQYNPPYYAPPPPPPPVYHHHHHHHHGAVIFVPGLGYINAN
ncbi:MAG: hypothetical protein POG74_03465 [Acidocella sp.]|nr:hypothetical protein [Acidocella sp.]